MILLRRRNQKVPSPFHNSRVAFLDQWFVQSWVTEYEQFKANPKNFKVSERYKQMVNNVDHVYLIHHSGGNHWVALHMDLLQAKIYCYDSIIRGCDDKKMLEECRPFTRMLPYILNEFIPTEIRKKDFKQFAFSRRKGIPQNDIVGDCGVYACKYVECLALGVTFEGLCDRNMPFYRLAIAADILNEAHDYLADFV